MREILYPLGPEHKQAIDRALERVPHVRELLAKMRESGIPVDEPESHLNQQAKMLETLKAKFFPQDI